MFEHDKGTWFCIILATLPFCVGSVALYNAVIPKGLSPIDGDIVMTEAGYAKICQIITWVGDVLTLLLNVDSMLQDVTYFPHWAVKFKLWYNTACDGWGRVVFVWSMFVLSTVPYVYGIVALGRKELTLSQWNETSLFSTDELGRTVICAVILICDATILLQDWEFPTFSTNTSIMIAGTKSTELTCHCFEALDCSRCHCCECCDPNFCKVTLTGKWMTYAPIVFVLFTEIIMITSIITYVPSQFGQYWDPKDHSIWSIQDLAFLEPIYSYNASSIRLLHPEKITWEARAPYRGVGDGVIRDEHSHSRYVGYDKSLLYAASSPAYIMLLFLIIIIIIANPYTATTQRREAHKKEVHRKSCLRWCWVNGTATCHRFFCVKCCSCDEEDDEGDFIVAYNRHSTVDKLPNGALLGNECARLSESDDDADKDRESDTLLKNQY